MSNLNSSTRKSRKERRCDWCGGFIAKGEKYKYQFGVQDGDPTSWSGHMDCDELAGWYWNTQGPDEGIPPFHDWEATEVFEGAQNQMQQYYHLVTRAQRQWMRRVREKNEALTAALEMIADRIDAWESEAPDTAGLHLWATAAIARDALAAAAQRRPKNAQ